MDLLSRLESSSLSRWLITLEIDGRDGAPNSIFRFGETPIMKNLSVRVLLIDSLLYP